MPKIIKIEKGQKYTLPCHKGGWISKASEDHGLLIILDEIEQSRGGVFISMDSLLKHLARKSDPKKVEPSGPSP